MDEDRHGWVVPRADGRRVPCGGPGACPLCTVEAGEQQQRRDAIETERRVREAMRVEQVEHRTRLRCRVWPDQSDVGLAWRTTCACGWRSELQPLAVLGAVHLARADGAAHVVEAGDVDTIERALIRWARSQDEGEA